MRVRRREQDVAEDLLYEVMESGRLYMEGKAICSGDKSKRETFSYTPYDERCDNR